MSTNTSTRMRTCFNCGARYPTLGNDDYDWEAEGFCTKVCMNQDQARLVEGNGIVAKAEVQLTDINKLKLDVSGPLGTTLGSMLHFGSRSNNNSNSNSAMSTQPTVIEPVDTKDGDAN